MNKDPDERLARLLRMEKMKIWSGFTIVFTAIVFVVLILQVGFVVRLDLEAGNGVRFPELIYDYAFRYVNNVAFTFIPILLLVNAGREFDYAIVQRSLVSGLTRRDYFLAKLMQLGIFSFFSGFLAAVCTLLTALLYSIPVIWDLGKILLHSAVAFCLGSLALMIVLVLQKRIHSLATFIVYVLLENTLVTVTPGNTILLPLHTCTRLLKQGIYEWPEFLMLAAYTFIFLSTGYQKLMRSDLR